MGKDVIRLSFIGELEKFHTHSPLACFFFFQHLIIAGKFSLTPKIYFFFFFPFRPISELAHKQEKKNATKLIKMGLTVEREEGGRIYLNIHLNFPLILIPKYFLFFFSCNWRGLHIYQILTR